MPPLPESLLCRRSAAREFLGVSDEEFSKLVSAEVLPPVYLVWDVVDRHNRIVFSANHAKALAYVAEHGNKFSAQPAGYCYFRTADVRALAKQEVTP